MKSNFEVIAYKNNKRIIHYIVLKIYSGVCVDIYNKYKSLGYKRIKVRMI